MTEEQIILWRKLQEVVKVLLTLSMEFKVHKVLQELDFEIDMQMQLSSMSDDE